MPYTTKANDNVTVFAQQKAAPQIAESSSKIAVRTLTGISPRANQPTQFGLKIGSGKRRAMIHAGQTDPNSLH